MQEKLAGYFALLLYAAGTVGLVWLCVRFILPWAAPFITAYLLAARRAISVAPMAEVWVLPFPSKSSSFALASP